MKLSTNFRRSENQCKCGDCNKFGADIELVNVMEEFRAHLRFNIIATAIIIVTSWFRCREHNNRPVSEGGAGSNDNSWHLTGSAIDIKVPGIPPGKLAYEFRKLFPNKYGVGIYDWGIHIDMRPKAGNWDKRTTIVT